MAITRGAKKAHRASLRKRVFNSNRKDLVSKTTKSLKKLFALGNKKEAEALMRQMQKALDKAVKNNTLKKNTASRRKSRFSKMVQNLPA